MIDVSIYKIFYNHKGAYMKFFTLIVLSAVAMFTAYAADPEEKVVTARHYRRLLRLRVRHGGRRDRAVPVRYAVLPGRRCFWSRRTRAYRRVFCCHCRRHVRNRIFRVHGQEGVRRRQFGRRGLPGECCLSHHHSRRGGRFR